MDDNENELEPGEGTTESEETESGTSWETSILKYVRHMIGPEEDYEYFDPDLIMHINSAFSRLCQLGVGPKTPFYIKDDSAVWTDFMEEGYQEDVKLYVWLSVKLDFDPPQNGSVMSSYEEKLKKLEYLLNSVAECGY